MAKTVHIPDLTEHDFNQMAKGPKIHKPKKLKTNLPNMTSEVVNPNAKVGLQPLSALGHTILSPMTPIEPEIGTGLPNFRKKL